MDYQEFVFTVDNQDDYQQDLLIDALAQIGFDSFEETQDGFKAYIPEAGFDENSLNDVLASFESLLSFSYIRNLIPQTNWNEVWESNFSPLEIGNTCYVRATFHDANPAYPY